jgi:hypothetical protein
VGDGEVIRIDPSALHASAAGPDVSTTALSADQVQPLLAEAVARWQASGQDTANVAGINVRIADLGRALLGLAAGNTIWLDNDAAGWGWFVDPTPSDDSEFTAPGDQSEQDRIDLLSALMHEVGHLLGGDHELDGVMQETLSDGER